MKAFLTVDVENASNAMGRSAFLAGLRRLAPGLVPWVDLCCRSPSQLGLGSRRVASVRGIQLMRGCGSLLPEPHTDCDDRRSKHFARNCSGKCIGECVGNWRCLDKCFETFVNIRKYFEIFVNSLKYLICKSLDIFVSICIYLEKYLEIFQKYYEMFRNV